jgi:hypothetical protein
MNFKKNLFVQGEVKVLHPGSILEKLLFRRGTDISIFYLEFLSPPPPPPRLFFIQELK